MPSRIKLYDNGGATVDRYSLFVPSVNEPGKEDWYAFNDVPYHPQGVGMFGGSDYPMPSYRHMGKSISFSDLPEQAQKFVRATITDPLPDGYGMSLPKAWSDKSKSHKTYAVSKKSKSRKHSSAPGLGTVR